MTVGDLTAPAGVTIVTDPETVVASVVAPTVEAAPEEIEVEGEEGAEPTAAGEGEDGGSDEE